MNEQDMDRMIENMAGFQSIEFAVFKRNMGTLEKPEIEYAWFRADGQQCSPEFTDMEESEKRFIDIPRYLKFIMGTDVFNGWERVCTK